MRVLTVLVILVVLALVCVLPLVLNGTQTGDSDSLVPAAPGVVQAIGTPVISTAAPVSTYETVPGDSAFPTPPFSTSPGADAPTPMALPTSVVPQMPTTGEWGLRLDLLRYLPSAAPASLPPAIPLPQDVRAIARLMIPTLGIDTPVTPAQPQVGLAMDGSLRVLWSIPNYAAGWHAESTPPGQAGNTVISGHNNVGNQVFRQLEEMQIGDAIYVQVPDGSTYVYLVRQVLVLPEDGQPESVRIANARYLLPTVDTRLTLVSCWPDWSNTERVVVVALP